MQQLLSVVFWILDHFDKPAEQFKIFIGFKEVVA